MDQLTRRQFLLGIGAGALFTNSRPSWLKNSDEIQLVQRPSHLFPVIQGTTDAYSANFVILAPQADTLRFEVPGISSDDLTLQTVKTPYGHPGTIYRLSVKGLNPSKTYTLKIISSSPLMDERTFSTLSSTKTRPRTVVLSCSADRFHKPQMWARLEAYRPDLIYFLGDIIYADNILSNDPNLGPGRIVQRYFEARQNIDFYYMKRLVPTIAVWDDHDYGANDGDRTNPYREESTWIFKNFYFQEDNSITHLGPGIGTVTRYQGVRNFLFDGRTFKDPVSKYTRRDGEFLGKEQEEWFFDELHSGNEYNILSMGYQWFGDFKGSEAVSASYPESLDRFLKKLRRTNQKFVLMSGNIHFSEISRWNDSRYGNLCEIVSSSIHSLTVPGWDRMNKNPHRIASTWAHNFIGLEGFSIGNRWDLNVHCIGEKTSYFQMSLEDV